MPVKGLQRLQLLALGAVVVRTLSLLVTAVISHPGKDTAEVGSITAQLRMKGNMINGVWPYTSEKSPLPEHESCGRASFRGTSSRTINRRR
jgi:hypothetical protein